MTANTPPPPSASPASDAGELHARVIAQLGRMRDAMKDELATNYRRQQDIDYEIGTIDDAITLLRRPSAAAPPPAAVADGEREWQKLAAELCRWTLCMSYNYSYFGEPEGLVKRFAKAYERAALSAPPVLPTALDGERCGTCRGSRQWASNYCADPFHAPPRCDNGTCDYVSDNNGGKRCVNCGTQPAPPPVLPTAPDGETHNQESVS